MPSAGSYSKRMLATAKVRLASATQAATSGGLMLAGRPPSSSMARMGKMGMVIGGRPKTYDTLLSRRTVATGLPERSSASTVTNPSPGQPAAGAATTRVSLATAVLVQTCEVAPSTTRLAGAIDSENSTVKLWRGLVSK